MIATSSDPIHQHVAEPVRHGLEQGQLDTGMATAEPAQEADEMDRPDRAHHTDTQVCLVQPDEAARQLLRLSCLRHHLAQLGLDQQAERGQMGIVALARDERPPISSSSLWIARVKAGWLTLHCSAALVKFSVSLRATKYRMAFNCMGVLHQFRRWLTLLRDHDR